MEIPSTNPASLNSVPLSSDSGGIDPTIPYQTMVQASLIAAENDNNGNVPQGFIVPTLAQWVTAQNSMGRNYIIPGTPATSSSPASTTPANSDLLVVGALAVIKYFFAGGF